MLRNAAVVIILASFFLVGCSSKPTESMAENIIKEQIAKNAHGLITLESFQKIDGQDFNLLGIQGYILEWKATVNFKQDVFWEKGSFAARPVAAGAGWIMMPAKKGIQEITGKMTFQKTENGWRGS